MNDLLQKSLIEPTSGAWSSPVVLVKRKYNKWHFCIDYRPLNAMTQQDAYALPRIGESVDALAGSMYFSTLDLINGYWQVLLDQDCTCHFPAANGTGATWNTLEKFAPVLG